MSADRKLSSISNFTQAGVSMGKHHVKQAAEMFELDNHSCYGEGWAAGYLRAMQIVAEFVEETVKEGSDD